MKSFKILIFAIAMALAVLSQGAIVNKTKSESLAPKTTVCTSVSSLSMSSSESLEDMAVGQEWQLVIKLWGRVIYIVKSQWLDVLYECLNYVYEVEHWLDYALTWKISRIDDGDVGGGDFEGGE